MRIKLSLKNLIYGSLSQASSSLLSFIVRYVLIHTLGAEAVSLNGLFREVIAMLSLAEMGVGTVITYNLYVPLKENNEKKLAELMNLFKKAYHFIALTILLLGLLLFPFVHLLVSKIEIELGYLRLIYFLFLIQTASSYLFSYKSALLNADQKDYIVSKYMMLVRTIFTGISIVFLILTRKYIIYLIIQIIATLTGNLAISAYADGQYPFLKRKDSLPEDEKKQVFSNVRYLFIGGLSGKIINSTDNILISVLVGTLHIGAYGSYMMLINPLKIILNQFRSATKGSIGNLMVEKNNRHTETVLKRLTFITYCPTIIATAGFYTVSTPFIRLLYGEMYTLPTHVVLVCAVNLLIYIIKNPLWSMLEVSGLFKEDKNISIAGNIVNLLVSMILGKKLGISGIVIGTICSLIVQHIMKIHLFFHDFLHFPSASYVTLLLKEVVVGILCLLTVKLVCAFITLSNLCLQVLLYGFISVFLTIGINFLFFRSLPEFEYMINIGKTMLSEKIGRERK